MKATVNEEVYSAKPVKPRPIDKLLKTSETTEGSNDKNTMDKDKNNLSNNDKKEITIYSVCSHIKKKNFFWFSNSSLLCYPLFYMIIKTFSLWKWVSHMLDGNL